jgi:hypothetical protein
MAGFITFSSQLMSLVIDSNVVFIIFIISEACTPLETGELGTQPFKVSETFSAPQCLKPLLT